jgi:hypothetical protein
MSENNQYHYDENEENGNNHNEYGDETVSIFYVINRIFKLRDFPLSVIFHFQSDKKINFSFLNQRTNLESLSLNACANSSSADWIIAQLMRP